MDNFDGPFMRITKFTISFFGFWHSQTDVERKLIKLVIFVIITSSVFTRVSKLLMIDFNMENATEIFSLLSTSFIFFIRFTLHIVRGGKMNDLLRQMEKYRTSLSLKYELQILEEQVVKGKNVVMLIIVCLYGALVTYLLIPFTSRVLDFVNPLNESRPIQFPYPGEYFVDHQRFFFSIYVHMVLCAFTEVTALMATDVILLTLLLHICVMFNIVGYELEHAFELNKDENFDEENTCRRIAKGVRTHNLAISMIKEINDFYGISWLIQVGAVVVMITILLTQTAALLHKIDKMVMYITFLLGTMAYLFINIFCGQILQDSSNTPYEKAFHSQWYLAPVEKQKLLLLIIQKSADTCRIRVGNVFPVSYEMYAAMIQTSVSYFTVLYSLQ